MIYLPGCELQDLKNSSVFCMISMNSSKWERVSCNPFVGLSIAAHPTVYYAREHGFLAIESSKSYLEPCKISFIVLPTTSRVEVCSGSFNSITPLRYKREVDSEVGKDKCRETKRSIAWCNVVCKYRLTVLNRLVQSGGSATRLNFVIYKIVKVENSSYSISNKIWFIRRNEATLFTLQSMFCKLKSVILFLRIISNCIEKQLIANFIVISNFIVLSEKFMNA